MNTELKIHISDEIDQFVDKQFTDKNIYKKTINNSFNILSTSANVRKYANTSAVKENRIDNKLDMNI